MEPRVIDNSVISDKQWEEWLGRPCPRCNCYTIDMVFHKRDRCGLVQRVKSEYNHIHYYCSHCGIDWICENEVMIYLKTRGIV